MDNGFWAGGAEAHERGLQQHYESRIAQLRQQLKDCNTQPERERLEAELARTRQEFDGKLREIARLIF